MRLQSTHVYVFQSREFINTTKMGTSSWCAGIQYWVWRFTYEPENVNTYILLQTG